MLLVLLALMVLRELKDQLALLVLQDQRDLVELQAVPDHQEPKERLDQMVFQGARVWLVLAEHREAQDSREPRVSLVLKV